jgi:hypothetical protein
LGGGGAGSSTGTGLSGVANTGGGGGGGGGVSGSVGGAGGSGLVVVRYTVSAEDSVYEPALGNPEADGYVLSSRADGTRSWVEGEAPVTPSRIAAINSPFEGALLMYHDTNSFVWVDNTTMQPPPAAGLNMQTTGPGLNMIT